MLVTLSACSSSKPSASKTSATTATSGSTPSSATPTGSAITVGVICSCSGPLGPSIAGSGDTAHAWARSVNASGGIDGHPIDLIFLDDASNPGTSSTDAQTLISDHVDVIADMTIFDTTWANSVAAAKIPVVGAFQSVPLGTNPDFYPTTQTMASLFYGQAFLAKQAGATNAGLIACTEAAQCSVEAPQMRAAGQQLGIPIVYSALVSATAPNYTAQCVAAQQAKVKALALNLAATTATNVGADCARQGYAPIYLLPSASYLTSQNTTPLGKNLWIDFTSLPFFANAPAVQAMNVAVDKYYPGLRQGKGAIWNEESTGGWIAGLLIRDAVKASGVSSSGTITATTMTQGLNSIKNDTLDGWAPPLTFTAGQPHPVNCWFAVKVINSTPSVLNNAMPTCENSSAS